LAFLLKRIQAVARAPSLSQLDLFAIFFGKYSVDEAFDRVNDSLRAKLVSSSMTTRSLIYKQLFFFSIYWRSLFGQGPLPRPKNKFMDPPQSNLHVIRCGKRAIVSEGKHILMFKIVHISSEEEQFPFVVKTFLTKAATTTEWTTQVNATHVGPLKLKMPES
jgi:hypothetical protein